MKLPEISMETRVQGFWKHVLPAGCGGKDQGEGPKGEYHVYDDTDGGVNAVDIMWLALQKI
jgi:hypothetical protein